MPIVLAPYDPEPYLKLNTWERRGRARNFADPFTHKLDYLLFRIWETADPRKGYDSKKGVLAAAAADLVPLRFNEGRAREKLMFFMEEFSAISRRVENFFEAFRGAAARRRAEHMKARFARHLEGLEEDWSEVQALHRNLPPAAIAVQLHFWEQVLVGTRGKESENGSGSLVTADFYAPLYEARDDYFMGTAPAELYLETVAAVRADPFFEARVRAGVPQHVRDEDDAKLEPYTSALLAAAMLEDALSS